MVAANPSRTSWSPEEVTGQLQLAWHRPIEAYIPQNSQIIASGGLLYVSTAKGLYALNAADGALAWRFDTEMPLGNSPTVANGVVYVGGYDRKLHALDAQSGRHLWAFSGAGAGYDTNPLVVDGRIFAGNRDGKMYAIGAHGTAQQGQLIWGYQTGGAIHLSAAYSEATVYFAANDNRAYALRASDGQLVWRSETLPSLQFQSYWPVVYRDMVIFSSAVAYRDGYSPGTSSLTNALGQPFGNYREIQLEGVFPEMAEGTTLGPVVAPQDWAHGYPIVNASRLTQYLEDNPASDPFKHKPWRRVLIALNRTSGTEFTYDSDGDGHPEYLPAAYWGTGSGNRYPPLVGPDNILYFGNIYLCCSDAKGRVMGWQPSTPSLLSVTGGLGALAEPQAISAGGNIIYRNICCDRRADWFNVLDPRAPAGQLWSYDLSTLAPAYDAQTWITLPGWPRLHGWYQGKSASLNAAYHNHGDQNPIVPYQGRLYTHRSNTIFAFARAPGPGALPQATMNGGMPGTSLATPTLQARLEIEIVKMLDTGNLRPGYYNVGQFLDRELADYFDNPGDTLYALAKAYPHLSSATQVRVRTYLRQHFDTYFDPQMCVTTGWATGAPREDIMFPPDIAGDLADHPPAIRAIRASWTYPPYNFYALWKYAGVVPDQAVRAYDLAKSKLQVPVPALPVADYFQQKPWELNAWIAGYIGFLELQELAGRETADATLRSTVTTELNRLLALRVNTFNKDSYWGPGNFTYKKRLDAARNFIYLVPELADYLYQQIPDTVKAAISEYEYIAPYWFVSRFESAIGESTMQHLYDYHALFLARAYILNQSQAELSKYIDVPAFARGDLFYIQNLVAALEAP
ncbi:MAG: PQQ-binding-like beta-propeller repeat protein [Anaerolineae bacterium]|nr:PQQ-binding-like beta-propeller repeat protein [Anaerolineae bacterium]